MRTIKQTVTVGEGGRIEIPASELPAGSTAEVTVVVEEAAINGSTAAQTALISSLLGTCKGQFASPEDADAYLEHLRKEWDADEERKRPIAFYYGKAKSAFKDAAEVDAFIRAERDA